MRKELQNIRQFDLMLVIEFFSTRWQGESIDLQWEIFKILIECLKKTTQNWVHCCWKHMKCTLELFDNYFCTVKSEKYFQKRNNGPISHKTWCLLWKCFWWLCTENFGPLRIPRPATNFLELENNWNNFLIDSKTCCATIWNIKFMVWNTRGKLCSSLTWIMYKKCEKYLRKRNNSSILSERARSYEMFSGLLYWKLKA